MKNDFVFKEYTCPSCGSNEHKQIPEDWTNDKIVSYYEDFYFCIHCGLHTKFKDERKSA